MAGDVDFCAHEATTVRSAMYKSKSARVKRQLRWSSRAWLIFFCRAKFADLARWEL
jgi:hypothetical protein